MRPNDRAVERTIIEIVNQRLKEKEINICALEVHFFVQTNEKKDWLVESMHFE